MAGSDDLSLDLRLPWDRPSQAAEQAAPKLPPRLPPPVPDGSSAPQPSNPPGALAGAEALVRIEERLQRVEEEISMRLERMEERTRAQDAGLEAQLEKLEAAHAASTDSTAMLAAHLLTHLADELSRFEGSLRHMQDQAEARLAVMLRQRNDDVVAAHEVMMEAISDLAPRYLLDRLLDGIATIGELLEAELVDIRRLVNDHPRNGASPEFASHQPDGPALGRSHSEAPAEAGLDMHPGQQPVRETQQVQIHS